MGRSLVNAFISTVAVDFVEILRLKGLGAPSTLRRAAMRTTTHGTFPMCNLTDCLTKTYGPLMSSAEAAVVMKYSSVNAMRMAMRRGLLTLRPARVPGRRGYFFATSIVAETVGTWLNPA